MSVVLFANNWAGLRIAESLRRNQVTISALVLHPEGARKYGAEILEASGVPASHVFAAPQLARKDTIDALRELRPELGISIYFGYILAGPLLACFPKGCINLHPSYLPFNRGAYPNVWSILDGTPAGVTLHHLDESIDSGDIIAQSPLPVCATDTAKSLYEKLESAAVDLFDRTWPCIANGTAPRFPNPIASGSIHRKKDVAKIDEIDLNQTYVARELIDLLRARTFPPYPGAYFLDNGRKVFLELNLRYELPGS